MRVALQRRRIRFGCADVHAAIDQRGVDTDQLQRESLTEFACQRGFTGGSGTHQEDGKGALVDGHRGILVVVSY